MENKINIHDEFPLISFIMPVYNDGDEVEKAITSIFDQDWPAIEVIAVNDGSQDDSLSILNKLKKKYEKLTVLNFEKNRGACVARNEGAKIAKGKYYAWLPADAKIYPGMVRVWVEMLEKYPDYDFLYGGYRFVDNEGNIVSNYLSRKFEPYLLEVSNYIDGSFPIKADSYWRIAKIMNQPDGLWDPTIKSLQDWDFWLSVVKEGRGKGIYYADIFFETTIPHPGGLSYDSHQNWLARTRAIKVKHGIPDRKICVTAPGAPFFGEYIAWILDADYKDMPPMKDHDYDLIYILGFYPSIGDTCAEVFVDPKVYPQYQELVRQNKEVSITSAIKVVHLIGTDLLQMSDLSKTYMGIYRHFLNGKYDYVFTEFDETQREAKSLGLNTEVLALPPRKYFDVTPLPEKFTVAVYAPETNQTLYNIDIMTKVAKALPKVEFKFFGNPKRLGIDSLLPNVSHVGYVGDMAGFIKDCSCLLRITTHDGLPQSVLEFLSAGRRVVFNHDFKYVNAEKRITVGAIVDAIKKEMKEPLNNEAAAWIRRNFSKEKYKEKIYSLLNYEPKKYWEKYANNWIERGILLYKTDDWDEIKDYVNKINPKSVIDIGCGDGRWSSFFETTDYLGIDISGKLIKHAQKNFPKKKFIESSLEDLSLEKKYDLAFCYTVFEHIKEEDMEKAVRALKKVAKKAILVEPINIETKYYCINHDYNKWFKIIKEKRLGKRNLMVVEL